MNIYKDLDNTVKAFLKSEFSLSVNKLEFQSTKKEFKGDITLVIFPLVKVLKISLDDIGEKIGSHLEYFSDYVVKFNLVKGFLNLTISDQYFINELYRIDQIENYGFNMKKSDSAIFIRE